MKLEQDEGLMVEWAWTLVDEDIPVDLARNTEPDQNEFQKPTNLEVDDETDRGLSLLLLLLLSLLSILECSSIKSGLVKHWLRTINLEFDLRLTLPKFRRNPTVWLAQSHSISGSDKTGWLEIGTIDDDDLDCCLAFGVGGGVHDLCLDDKDLDKMDKDEDWRLVGMRKRWEDNDFCIGLTKGIKAKCSAGIEDQLDEWARKICAESSFSEPNKWRGGVDGFLANK